VLSHSPAAFAEPAFTYTKILHNLNVSFQYGMAYLLTHNMTTIVDDFDLTDAYVPFFLGFGLSTRLPRGKENKNAENSPGIRN
jgi:hypothetical protein